MVEKKSDLLDPSEILAHQKQKRLGVQGVVIDLDDFLLQTSTFIQAKIHDYVGNLARQYRLDYDETRTTFNRISDAAFATHHVKPSRWTAVARELHHTLPGQPDTFSSLPLLLSIYQNSPDFIPGALSFLKFVKNSGLKLAIVTNSSYDWGIVKADRLGLWEYLDSYLITDENRPKNIADWQKGLDSLNLSPDQVIGGGDSVKLDQIPLQQLGVKAVLGVPAQFLLAQGEVPAGVIMKPSIADYAQAILEIPE